MKKNIKDVYDSCSLLVKQAESQVEDGQQIDQSILNTLESVFNDIINFTKVYLIQCQDSLWGTMLMNIDFGVNFTQRGAVNLVLDSTSVKLEVNPLFCADYKFSEFIGLVINELVKMVYLHPVSFAKINHEKDPSKHEKLEQASSAASTSIVLRDIHLDGTSNGCKIPHDAFTTATLNATRGIQSQKDMPLEYYFKILEKFKNNNNSSSGGNNSTMSGTGSSGSSNENPSGQPSDAPGDPNGTATKNNNNGSSVHNWEGTDEDESKEKIKSIVSESLNSLSERARGYVPSSIMNQIKAMLAPPEIDWKQILRKMVGSVPVPYRKTRSRLNRRQPYRSDLCGRLPDRTVNVVCCFDTSGSMSDKDLMYCMNEVFNIVSVYKGYKVTIIECDAEIQKVYEAKKISDLQLKMAGRGGTSFIPVINFINGDKPYDNPVKYPKAGKFKDALMVYFTDGFGDSSIPKPKTFRNLWVVMDDEKNLSLKEPYGDVKSLKKDKDYQQFKNQ